MANQVEVVLPKLGESIVAATVVQWLKQEGERIEVDDPIVEVATDKVNSEIPSPVAGILTKQLASVDQEVEVGQPLAIVDSTGVVEKKSDTILQAERLIEGGREASVGFLSPAVLRLAQERGIALERLKDLKGSGRGGRVTKRDIERLQSADSATLSPCPAAKTSEAPLLKQGEEEIPLTPMRKAIAEAMVRSVREAPHAYMVAEADITNALREIRAERDRFQMEHGAKLTITSYMLHAIARAARRYPKICSTWSNGSIIVKNAVNIGLAVEVPEGLVVPVLRGCESKRLPEIAVELGRLSARARQGELLPDDVQGGTITLTNFGMSGALIGLPILRYPEAAILGLGAIRKSVRVVGEDQIAIRDTVQISLGIDHRILDGMYAGGFLRAVVEELENQ